MQRGGAGVEPAGEALHHASSSGLIVFGEPRPSLARMLLDGGALAFTQQRVGGAVDVGGGDTALVALRRTRGPGSVPWHVTDNTPYIWCMKSNKRLAPRLRIGGGADANGMWCGLIG